MMRILHVHNLAGVASNLSLFQRKLGLESRVIAKSPNPFGYEEEHYSRWNIFPLQFFLTYDVIHYHGGTWFRRKKLKQFDYHLCKRLRKKIVLHFHGSDVRRASAHQELAKVIDDLKTVLLSTPDLLAYFPSEKGVWLPNPINTEMWHFKPRIQIRKSVFIGYYSPPSTDAYMEKIYGVKHIKRAIKALKRKGSNVEGKPVWGKSYREMPSYYSSIDVYVDRLGMGCYGLSACEAMASGLPVITYVNEGLRHFLPSKEPFLITSKENLVENLEALLSDESLRKQLIQRGKRYVLDVHDGLKIAKSVVKIYQNLGKVI